MRFYVLFYICEYPSNFNIDGDRFGSNHHVMHIKSFLLIKAIFLCALQGYMDNGNEDNLKNNEISCAILYMSISIKF